MITASSTHLPARIERTSRHAAFILCTTVFATPVLLALYVASSFAAHHPWLSVLHVNAAAFDTPARAALFAATLAAILPMLWGLDQVRRLFNGYAAGEVYTERAALHFGRFATALMVTALAGPAAIGALSLAFSALGTITPSGVISISSTDAGLLLIGGLLRVIASVLYGAAQIADENASFF